MYQQPTAMTNRTTPTLIATSKAFVVTLSRMPSTRTMVTAAITRTAGKLSQAPSIVNGSLDSCGGTCQRKKTSRNSLKYLVQSAATTPQLMAYSRIKSQPMIQAKNSPRVAYAYV